MEPSTPAVADVTSACDSACAVNQITVFEQVLATLPPDPNPAERLKAKQALSFLVHLIGDIHQPLHAADRNSDRGGNLEHVNFFGTNANHTLVLHGIWDNQIVARIAPNEGILATRLKKDIKAARKETVSSPADWALESYRFARDVAYHGIPSPNGTDDVASLAQAYQNKAAPVVRKQLARAGVRLANALTTVLP